MRQDKVLTDDEYIASLPGGKLTHPELDPKNYYKQVASNPYFLALVSVRHQIRLLSEQYFDGEIGAKNIDLFMMTSSVSSPAGSGSDSEPIPLTFGDLPMYLVDSSQFGFEPILVGGIPKAYCYLASLRGENPDARHLNQFYHCEYEAQETMEQTMAVAEEYVRALITLVHSMPNAIERMSLAPDQTKEFIQASLECKKFPSIEFDEAIDLLEQNGFSDLVPSTPHGKDLTAEGEQELLKILNVKTPIWVKYYPRDRVPFYQKPISGKPNRVLNADLLFPALTETSFGGEVLGMGQRQDNPEELYDSMNRQEVDPSPYEWYVDLRRMLEYKTTSGFGLGIERFISWIFAFDSIYKAILYPRMKGFPMNP